MEDAYSINIKKTNIPYFKRVQYYIKIGIGMYTLFGLLYAIGNKSIAIIPFILVVSLFFTLVTAISSYKTKLHLTSFSANNKKAEMHYLHFSEKKTAIVKIEELTTILKNTSSRSGFNCELIILVSDKKFIINKDFDWDFYEIKKIFEFVKYQKKEKLSEKEIFILSKIEHKLKKA